MENKLVINDLIILEEFKKHHRPYYRFQCVCGKIGEAVRLKIIKGHTRSCGCRRAKVHQPKNTTLPPKNSVENKVMWYMIYDANKRGIDFKLNKNYFTKLITSPCFYCGINHISQTTFKGQTLSHNGIDRIDSSLGYVINNVRPCCKICNLAKNRMSDKDFLAWIKLAYNHNYGPTINSVNSVNI